ncbi:secretoglobin family 2B member 3 [Cricetulus griseus]
MKGTLFLLALLVTGELGFQKTEACGPYFELYTTMVTGDKAINNALISKFDPTDQERVAYDKLQECYNELGLEGKALDGLVLASGGGTASATRANSDVTLERALCTWKVQCGY